MRSTADYLHIESQRRMSQTRLTLRGEVDVSSVPLLGLAIAGAVSGGISRISIDCTEVTLFGAAGVSALVVGRLALLSRSDRPITVVGASPVVERVLAACGLSEMLVPGPVPARRPAVAQGNHVFLG